ncbi:hypothetical protein BH18ACI5_BH18ACI5_09540 [soil metagenome]
MAATSVLDLSLVLWTVIRILAYGLEQRIADVTLAATIYHHQ